MRIKQCNDVHIDFDQVVAIERAYNINGSLSGAIVHAKSLLAPLRICFNVSGKPYEWLTPAQAEETFSFILKLWKGEQ